MSARQLRRLQNLVKASTGADDEDVVVAEELHPSTMKIPGGGKKSARRQRMTGRKAQVEAGSQHHQEEEWTLVTSLDKTDIHREADNRSERAALAGRREPEVGRRLNKEVEVRVAKVAVDGVQDKEEVTNERRNKRQRNRHAKAKRREKEREEELLLEAALRQREEDATVGGAGLDTGGKMSEEVNLLELLSVCDAKKLDTREERIRRFGARAVEDVGDGRVPTRRAENRPASLLFAEHGHFAPRFFHSLLATPNRYSWPQYDGLGVALVVKETKAAKDNQTAEDEGKTTAGSPLVYYLDDSTAETRRADMALAVCGSTHGGVEGIMQCLAAAPYHIPTLIIASNAFETMGSVPRAQEAIDIALYHVGVLLSRFPVRQTVRRRCLPFSIASNKQLFQVLRCGVQQALRKAATRTAWETAKLIYSLDDTDPLGMLLQLDYLALRAKRWAWLVQVYFIVIREIERDADDKEAGNLNDARSNRGLALALSTLPGFFFSAALAKYFLEREEATCVGPTGSSGSKTPNVIREMKPPQLHALRNTPPAAVMLAHAIGRFPSAAVLLVEKIGGLSVLPSAPASWQDVVRAHEMTTEEHGLHVASMWVARNAEMWKAAEPSAFLRRVIQEDYVNWLKTYNDANNNTSSTAAVTVTVDALHPLTPWKHALLKEEDILGPTLSAIPAHLLDTNEFTEEDLRDEARRATSHELGPMEQITLLRFEALYGPLSPATLLPAERLARYSARFEEEGRGRQIGEEHNPLFLFFRTFLPWNSMQEMTLRAALDAAGIPDPAVNFIRRPRLEDEILLQDEYEEEEENGWETEESWYDDAFFVETDSDEV
ncbi:putative transcription factor 25-like [Trypanosoma rangeli]|uniref:Putative transcription factor 25-like n=1 Tax=Trypanosoma rangeli TaxID=5698 RepID=A0A3R7KGE4_TRYRA|nr:putative transcription factor 25-like [Trypanosoma rangeli]RNF07180.1 putative transcription factor 25-like [Trypanosoma rangeli]|eukprot:RNF07180.1 putative transcription factor 25-like [Trypanosoma rangeli]